MGNAEILKLLTEVSNVTGISEEYQWPLEVQKEDTVLEVTHAAHWMKEMGNDEILKLLTEVSNVTGISEEYQYPKTIPIFNEEPLLINHIADAIDRAGDIKKLVEIFGIPLFEDEPMRDSGGRKFEVPDPGIRPSELKKIENKFKPLSTIKKEFETYYELFQFVAEVATNFENIFPRVEIKESEIEASLLYPKQSGVKTINNIPQLYEALFLYLNNTIGDPKIPTVLESENPELVVPIENFNLSDILRKTHRQSLEINKYAVLIQDIVIRILFECLTNHKMNAINSYSIAAIVEDLGFLTDETEIKKVPMAADPYLGTWDDEAEKADLSVLDKQDSESIKQQLGAFLREALVPVPVLKKHESETTDLRDRSEERRVGKECRSRWSPYH